jgi:hypothetical protein
MATSKLLHFVAQHTVSFFSQKAVLSHAGPLQSRILPWFSFFIWPKRKKMPQTAAFFAHSFFTESKPIGLHNTILYAVCTIKFCTFYQTQKIGLAGIFHEKGNPFLP